MNSSTIEQFYRLIKTLNERIWEHRANRALIDEWLDNFGPSESNNLDRYMALFLLSKFLYFGDREIRALLRAMYRDLVKAPIVATHHEAGRGGETLAAAVSSDLARIRFLAVGNPSESGSHLLYYFRQENRLSTSQFITSHEVFSGYEQNDLKLLPDVDHYVFIDDFCGSGTQAKRYSKSLVQGMRTIAERTGAKIKISYFSLLATCDGLSKVRKKSNFDSVDAVVELDESFRAFDERSRYFIDPPNGIERTAARELCSKVGAQIAPTSSALGFQDGQLLLGFQHNTPNNTLPIVWAEGTPTRSWKPLFKRYTKVTA